MSSLSPPASQLGARAVTQSGRAAKRNPILELQTQLDMFNMYYRVNLLQNEQQAYTAHQSRKETRIRNARSQAMTTETWLGPEAMAALMDILSNPSDADAYLMYQDDVFRKAWLKRKLQQVGYTSEALTENL